MESLKSGVESVIKTQSKAFEDPVYRGALVVSLIFTAIVILAAVSLLVSFKLCEGSKSKKKKKICEKIKEILAFTLAISLLLTFVALIISQIILMVRSPKAFAQRALVRLF